MRRDVVAVLIEVLGLSLALAVDAGAVSAGLAAAGRSRRHQRAAALTFGLAQAGMAGAGALGGVGVQALVGAGSHLLAAALLLVVGALMLRGDGGEPGEPAAPPTSSTAALAALALATSLDALAAGVALPLLALPLWLSLGCIGTVTTLLCLVAGAAGSRAGAWLGPWGMRAAGLVLVGFGLRQLWTGALALGLGA